MNSETIKLCLDLNIWLALIIADTKGQKGTSVQKLVTILRSGYYNFYMIELIISWKMLNGLSLNIQKKLNVSENRAKFFVETVKAYSEISPSITLGGGTTPLKDEEDADVLETALAGKADLLITRNFKDFITYNDTYIITLDRHAIHYGIEHQLHIVDPGLALQWLKTDSIPNIPPLP